MKLSNGLSVGRSRGVVYVLLEKEIAKGYPFKSAFTLKDIKVNPRTGELGVIRRIEGKNRFIRLKDMNLREVVFDIEDTAVKRKVRKVWSELKYGNSLKLVVDKVGVRDLGVTRVKGVSYWTLGKWNVFDRSISLSEALFKESSLKRQLKNTLAHEVGHSLLDHVEFNLHRVDLLKKWGWRKGDYKLIKLAGDLKVESMMDLWEWYTRDAARKLFGKKVAQLSDMQWFRLTEEQASDIGRYLLRKRVKFKFTPLFVDEGLLWLYRVKSALTKVRRLL